MIIHIVKPGETIYSIAEYYNISVKRLVLENGIANPDNLAIGQTIVIAQPEIVYTIQAGDSLESIAQKFNVSSMELLRNNPYLSGRNYFYAGESIVISYQTNKTRKIATIGYAFTYIEKTILIKTLPFLTYLSIFNYRITSDGDIISIGDDTELIDLAKKYGVAPMMFVSTITEEGSANYDVTYNIIGDPSLQDYLISNVIQTLKEKGYYGINIYAAYITFETIDAISKYLEKAAARFHAEGYSIIISVTPNTNYNAPKVSIEELIYSKLAMYVDAIIFSSYDWALSSNYPLPIVPINILNDFLNYAASIVPSNKIYLGSITLGYDWKLPYAPGSPGATVITDYRAIEIAAEYNIPIQYNEEAGLPYFYYMDINMDLHMVWFKDARSFDARAELVEKYDLKGISIWTIMRFNTQMWLIINNQYYIERLEKI